MHKTPVRWLLVLFSIIFLVITISCGSVDHALESVDSAIVELQKGNKTFADITKILEDTKHKLDKGEYKSQVDEMVNRVGQVGQKGGEAFVDFTRSRVIEDLQNLKRSIRGEHPLERLPVLSNSQSPKIDITSTSLSTLSIVGWNLDVAKDHPEKFSVVVHNAKTGERTIDDRFVTYQGQYEVTLNLSSSGIKFHHFDSKLVFKGFNPQFEIAIINSDPPVAKKPTPLPPDVHGFLINENDNRVSFVIHETGRIGETTIVIRRANKSMGWKKVVLKNNNGDISAAETKDQDNGNEITVVAGHLVGNLKLSFGKAGFLALWKGVVEIPVTKESLLGKRITYTWERD